MVIDALLPHPLYLHCTCGPFPLLLCQASEAAYQKELLTQVGSFFLRHMQSPRMHRSQQDLTGIILKLYGDLHNRLRIPERLGAPRLC